MLAAEFERMQWTSSLPKPHESNTNNSPDLIDSPVCDWLYGRHRIITTFLRKSSVIWCGLIFLGTSLTQTGRPDITTDTVVCSTQQSWQNFLKRKLYFSVQFRHHWCTDYFLAWNAKFSVQGLHKALELSIFNHCVHGCRSSKIQYSRHFSASTCGGDSLDHTTFLFVVSFNVSCTVGGCSGQPIELCFSCSCFFIKFLFFLHKFIPSFISNLKLLLVFWSKVIPHSLDGIVPFSWKYLQASHSFLFDPAMLAK